MYCASCGQQLPDGSSYCSNCGTKLNFTGSVTQKDSELEKKVKKLKRKNIVVTILCIIFFLLFVLNFIFQLNDYAQIEANQYKVDAFDIISDFCTSSYNRNYVQASFKVDKNIVIVHQGESVTVTVTAETSEGLPASCNVENSDIANISDAHHTNESTVEYSVYGLTAGSALVTFSDSRHVTGYKMLVIVI